MTFSIFDIFLIMPPFSEEATSSVKVISITWNTPSGLDVNWTSPTTATITFNTPATLNIPYDEV